MMRKTVIFELQKEQLLKNRKEKSAENSEDARMCR